MEGIILGFIILCLIAGIIIGCWYCALVNRVQEVRLIRNWPFMRICHQNQYNLVHMTNQRKVRQPKRRRNNQQQGRSNPEEVVVLPIEN